MTYYVFLDTNIYEESNFSFENRKFTKLKELIKSKRVVLLYNEVIYGELKTHIESNIKEAVREYNAAIKNKNFAPFRSKGRWSEHLTLLDESELIKYQLQEMDNFLKECDAIKIPTNNVNVDVILNNYFKKILPFENKKPTEFKDAILIESIQEYFEMVRENEFVEELYVVSRDKGVRKSFRNDKKILTFDNLNKFINYVMIHTEHLALAVSKQFSKELFDIYIQNNIMSEMNFVKFDVEDCYDGFEVKDIQYSGCEIGYIDAIDKDSVEVTLEILAKVCIDYMERDEKNSYYNEEEGAYLFDAFTEYMEWHEVRFEAILVMDVEGGDENVIKEKIESCNDLLEEYDDSVLKIMIGPEKIMIPKGTVILMNGGTSIERKAIRNVFDGWEYGGYCVSCGKKLLYNDYGINGLCKSCAPDFW